MRYGVGTREAKPDEAKEIYRALETIAIANHRLQTLLPGMVTTDLPAFLEGKFKRTESSTPHAQVAITHYETKLQELKERRYRGVLQYLVKAADTTLVAYDESTYAGQVNVSDSSALTELKYDDLKPAYKWVEFFGVKTQEDAQALQPQTGIITLVREPGSTEDQRTWKKASVVFDAMIKGEFYLHNNVDEATSLSDFVSKLFKFFKDSIHKPQAIVKTYSAIKVTIAQLIKTESGQRAVNTFLQQKTVEHFQEAQTGEEGLKILDSLIADATLTRDIVMRFRYSDVARVSSAYSLKGLVYGLLTFAGGAAIEAADSVERLEAVRSVIEQLAQEDLGKKVIKDVLEEDKDRVYKTLHIATYDGCLKLDKTSQKRR